ncbi:hypothetical protein Q7P37_008674 [Cladosporium fusiforme]
MVGGGIRYAHASAVYIWVFTPTTSYLSCAPSACPTNAQKDPELCWRQRPRTRSDGRPARAAQGGTWLCDRSTLDYPEKFHPRSLLQSGTPLPYILSAAPFVKAAKQLVAGSTGQNQPRKASIVSARRKDPVGFHSDVVVRGVEAFGFAVYWYEPSEPFGAHLLACCATINHISTLSVPPLVAKRFILLHNTHPDIPSRRLQVLCCFARSIDCFTSVRQHHTAFAKKATKGIPNTITTMSSSKFVEILDNDATPFSHANVSLEATLDETRRRTSASSIASSSDSEKSSSQRPTPPPSPTTPTSPVKMRLRAFSLRRPKA